jgi:hypothetical protein
VHAQLSFSSAPRAAATPAPRLLAAATAARTHPYNVRLRKPLTSLLMRPIHPLLRAQDRAMAAYGLTFDELTRLPCSWRSFHGNSYAVWSHAVLKEAQGHKRMAADEAAYETYGGAEGYAAHLAAEAAVAAEKAEKAGALARMTGLARQAAALGPGCSALAALPAVSTLNKKESSGAPFLLSEKDLKALPSSKPGRDLQFALADVLRAAQRKAGGEAAFGRKRRADADAAAAARRAPVDAELAKLSDKYPEMAAPARAAAAAALAESAAQLEARAAALVADAAAARAAATAAALAASGHTAAAAADEEDDIATPAPGAKRFKVIPRIAAVASF